MDLLTTDSWRAWCDEVFWCDAGPRGAMEFRGGDVVFCKIDEVLRFFERLRLTRRRVVLVTGEGDLPCDRFRQRFLPDNVAHWFATNVTQPHPRVTALPLGLGSPLSATTLRAGEILEARGTATQREKWLYVNFRPDTNPSERGPAFEHFRRLAADERWITFQPPSARGTNAGFLDELVRHRFVLCPPGNGVDTHRMWETLLAGAIPVVRRSSAMEPFAELPILFVDDFREVTLARLESATEEIAVPAEVPHLAREEFWSRKVAESKASLFGREKMGLVAWVSESLRYAIGMVERRIRGRGL